MIGLSALRAAVLLYVTVAIVAGAAFIVAAWLSSL